MPPSTVDSDSAHDAAYHQGFALIRPYLLLGDRVAKPVSSAKDVEKIHAGISFLEAASSYRPDAFEHHWTIGKAYQALGLHQLAYESFKKSHELQPDHPAVAREFANACLELGLGAEGVAVARRAQVASPADPGLMSNLALALLINGEIDEARKTVDLALSMNPGAGITRHLATIINEVGCGKRPAPKSLPELKRSA